MPSRFSRRYMRDKPGAVEVAVGVGVLLILAAIVVSFITISLAPGRPLFEVQIEGKEEPAFAHERQLAIAMMPPLGTAGWAGPGEPGGIATRDIEVWDQEQISGLEGDRRLLGDFDVTQAYLGRYVDVDDPQRYVSVLIVDASLPRNAFGLCFAKKRVAAPTEPLPVGNGGWQSGDTGAFWAGRHYVEFTRHNVGADGPTIKVIAGALASVHLRYGPPFWAESALPEESRIAGSFRFIRRGALSYPFLEDVFVADYDNGCSIFAGRMGSAAGAETVIHRFAEFLEQAGRIQATPDKSGSPLLAGDYADATRQLAVFADRELVCGVVGPDMGSVSQRAKAILARIRPAGPSQVSQTSPDSATDDPLFPDAIGLNWLSPTNVRVFTPENLWEKIDGRAEFYISFGMTNMTFGTYKAADDPAKSIDVYWYDQGSPDGAFGVYRAEYGGHSAPLDIGREGYTAGGSVFFWKGRHYLRIEAPQDTNEYVEASEAIGRAIADVIADDGGKMWADALLPEPGRLDDSFEYLAESAFGFEFLSDVFSATYEVQGRRFKMFIHRADDAAAAAEVFDNYAAFFKDYGKLIEQSDGTMSFLVGESGGVFDAVFRVGEYLGGTTGADDGDAAREAAREFGQTLVGDR